MYILCQPLKILFFILVPILSFVIGDPNLDRPLKPLGPLGVRLDYSFATAWPPDRTVLTGRNYLWSSHLTFAKSVDSITDGQLWQLARDAFNEMPPDRIQYGIGKKWQAGVMTVLAFGNEIIFASSTKGSSSYTYEYHNTPVLQDLQLCQVIWRDCAWLTPYSIHLANYPQLEARTTSTVHTNTTVVVGKSAQHSCITRHIPTVCPRRTHE